MPAVTHAPERTRNIRDAVIGAVADRAGYKAAESYVKTGRRFAAYKETAFWQSALASPAVTRCLAMQGLPVLRLQAAEKLLVPLSAELGATETALVLLDPAFPNDELVVLDDAGGGVSRDDLVEGWLSLCHQAGPLAAMADRVPGALNALAARGLLRDREIPAFIVAGRLPELELTGVPSPPLGINSGGKAIATAGIAATNGSGVFGVTAPYHSMIASGSGPVVGASVSLYVPGKGLISGMIQTADQISDSCFISLSPSDSPPLRPVKGILSKVTPRMNQAADFEGITSGQAATTILGWSPDLPFVQPYSQLKVFTSPDTSVGDSGAALVDSDGYLVGFAFYRTSLTGPIQYSAWVWAESVFQVHGLR